MDMIEDTFNHCYQEFVIVIKLLNIEGESKYTRFLLNLFKIYDYLFMTGKRVNSFWEILNSDMHRFLELSKHIWNKFDVFFYKEFGQTFSFISFSWFDKTILYSTCRLWTIMNEIVTWKQNWGTFYVCSEPNFQVSDGPGRPCKPYFA